ncbi:hypothetical protein TanjilG_17468 [Lupinus angustifolius]|uniref:Uncharacterized protein n=1 Tax=Lupinus angustifolius TaxID=3871 RepID=A0A4P1R1R3_LUPAN|nr:hypothetical protein TanjilG_17468 [Lupinus angustifolius]
MEVEKCSSSSVDYAKKGHRICYLHQSVTITEKSDPRIRGSHSHNNNKGMGDIFYGGDDCEEIKNYMYKEDVLFECMRKETELKAFKKRQKKRQGCFFQCFQFFRLFFRCTNL